MKRSDALVNSELKIRRRRDSTTADLVEGAWGEVAVAMVRKIAGCCSALRWLNTVLRAVSGNSRDRAVFVTNKRGGKKAMVHRRRFLKIYSLKFCDIWQNFYFYRILDNENFKMEAEQTNFVTHLVITMQFYY